jgi:FkbM family methyltransferase
LLTRVQARIVTAVDASKLARDMEQQGHNTRRQLAELLRTQTMAQSQTLTAIAALQRQLGDPALLPQTVEHPILERVLEHARSAEQAASRALAGVEYLMRSRSIALGPEVLCRTSSGWLLVPAEDLRLVAAMAEQGDSLEPGTATVVRAILSPGDLALDVGANIGAISLVMAAAVGPSGQVVAFEPTPRCLDVLRRTLALNGLLDRVEIAPVAVGAESRTARLHLGLTSSHNSLFALAESDQAIEVQVGPLDQLVTPGASPALVKIDVEGAELEVLRGMRQVIARSPDIALIAEFGPSHLVRAGVSSDDWLRAFRAEGFSPWLIDETSGAVRPIPDSGLEGHLSLNLLMLRQPPGRWPRLHVQA